jgi:hypothetical protein
MCLLPVDCSVYLLCSFSDFVPSSVGRGRKFEMIFFALKSGTIEDDAGRIMV